jgi:putative flippase GtrA
MFQNEIGKLIRYGLVGIINSIVGFSMILTAMALGVGPVTANALGYAVGLLTSFVLNTSWSFQQSRLTWASAARFLVSFGIAYTLNLLVLAWAISAQWKVILAQATAVIAYQAAFYLLLRLAVFKTVPARP